MLALTSRAKAVLLATTVAASGFGGWWLRDLQADAADGARAVAEAAADRRLNALANQVATRTETALAGIRIENRTIYNETQREIQTNTVYRDCVLPADGVRLANRARAGTASQSGGAVPAATAPAGQDNAGRPAGR